MASEQTADHCADLVREGNRPRFVSALFAQPDMRRRLLALYALDEELLRISQSAREPMLAAMRFQWWRDAIDRLPEFPVGHPVLTELAQSDLSRVSLQTLVDARESANATGSEQTLVREAARICGGPDEVNPIADATGAALATRSSGELQTARALWRTNGRTRKAELPAYLPATVVDMRHPVTMLRLYARMLIKGLTNRF